jgi:predicted esterase
VNPRTFSIRTSRTARYHVSGNPERPKEVWFLLHGYGQLAEDFLLSCGALVAKDRLLVAPEALSRFYTKGLFEHVGASWMTKSEREHEIDDYVAYLDAVCEAVLGGLTEPVRVCVLGFSQGAATASRWVAMGDVPAARLVCWAGDVPGDIPNAAQSLRGVQLSIVFGTRDRLITAERRDQFLERLDLAGLEYELIPFEGVHELDEATLRAVGRAG